MELYRPFPRGASRAFETAVDLWSTSYLNEKYRCGFNLNESIESIKKIGERVKSNLHYSHIIKIFNTVTHNMISIGKH